MRILRPIVLFLLALAASTVDLSAQSSFQIGKKNKLSTCSVGVNNGSVYVITNALTSGSCTAVGAAGTATAYCGCVDGAWTDFETLFSGEVTSLPIAAGPTAATDACVAGTFVASDSYLNLCVATDTWKRVAITSWEAP